MFKISNSHRWFAIQCSAYVPSYLLNTKYTELFLLWNFVRNIYVHVYIQRNFSTEKRSLRNILQASLATFVPARAMFTTSQVPCSCGNYYAESEFYSVARYFHTDFLVHVTRCNCRHCIMFALTIIRKMLWIFEKNIYAEKIKSKKVGLNLEPKSKIVFFGYLLVSEILINDC